MLRTAAGLMLALLAAAGPAAGADFRPDDPYRRYIAEAPEFRPVRPAPGRGPGRWDTWVFMPWRHKWTVGTNQKSGELCRKLGINGGFLDRGEGPLDWLDRWNLRFYVDHLAGKGDLHLAGTSDKSWFQADQRNARALRHGPDGPRPLDAAARKRLEAVIARNLSRVAASPNRIAYALDDEISWGAFVNPLPWRLDDDDAAYQAWLETVYGPGLAPKARYVTPDFLRDQKDRPLGQLDFSPLLDRMSYNDSVWANFFGDLVQAANRIDPDTPCGFVGGQAPNLWGGFDYAKLGRKAQFVEAYDLGSAPAILRSLDPGGEMPLVATLFHSDRLGVPNDIAQAWRRFAHGDRGMIAWVDESWFDGEEPRPWLRELAPTLRELGSVQGPKLAGARWVHDGVALLYSHPSVQVSWCLDSEPHGSTWPNRNDDHRLGTSHSVRRAWEYILADSGIQPTFLAYDDLIRTGVPPGIRTLILPACFALSDAEAEQIRAFHDRGGTVIADFAPGLFDQHGRGRARGVLDDLFGVVHDGSLTKADFFGGKLWVESDQDAGYGSKTRRALLDTVASRLQDGFAVAEPRLPVGTGMVRGHGRGRSLYLNLSPQRYLQYREEGTATDDHRKRFVSIIPANNPPRIDLKQDGKRPRDVEVTYQANRGRLYAFVTPNLASTVTPEGGGGLVGLKARAAVLDIALRFPGRDVVDERTGRKLGDVSSFQLEWDGVSAAMFSLIDPEQK